MYMYIIFCQPHTQGGGFEGVRSNPTFLRPCPLFDDHFQLESRLVLVLVHRTLDEIYVHVHVLMLIHVVHNCTRLYCLDLANQYWPSGIECDRTPFHVICIYGLVCS